MTEKEWKEYKENLRQLNHSIDQMRLRCIITNIAEAKTQEVDLRSTPLHEYSPAQICELLEELNWQESDILIDRHWTDITFWSSEWKFELHLSFNGFEWTMNLYKGEEDDKD